jgi:hypothetical protein
MCGECRSLRERQLESSTNGTNSLLGIIIGAEQTIPPFLISFLLLVGI